MGNTLGVNYLNPTNHNPANYPNNAIGAVKEGLEGGKIVSDMRSKRQAEKDADDVMREISLIQPGDKIPPALMMKASQHFPADVVTASQVILDKMSTQDQDERNRYLTDMETNNKLTGEIVGKMYDVPEEERAQFLQAQLAAIENPDLRGYYTDNFLEMFRDGDFSDAAMKLFSATLLGHDTWIKKVREAKQRDTDEKARLALIETNDINDKYKQAQTDKLNSDGAATTLTAQTGAGRLAHDEKDTAAKNALEAWRLGNATATQVLDSMNKTFETWVTHRKNVSEANDKAATAARDAKVLKAVRTNHSKYGGSISDWAVFLDLNSTAMAGLDRELNLGSYLPGINEGGSGQSNNQPPTGPVGGPQGYAVK